MLVYHKLVFVDSKKTTRAFRARLNMRKKETAMREFEEQPQNGAEGVVEGRNAVTEALRAGMPIDKIYLAKGDTDHTLGRIAALARKAGIGVVEADRTP